MSHEKEDEKDGADHSNKQTTTKKKKKLVPVTKKESKVEADSKDSKHNIGTKTNVKEVSIWQLFSTVKKGTADFLFHFCTPGI